MLDAELKDLMEQSEKLVAQGRKTGKWEERNRVMEILLDEAQPPLNGYEGKLLKRLASRIMEKE